MTNSGTTTSRIPASRPQLEALNRILGEVWRCNAFYRRKWRAHVLEPRHLEDIGGLGAYPFVTRDEVSTDQRDHPPLGCNLTRPAEEYRYVHSSSGSSGAPIFWPDTEESWAWIAERSAALHRVSGIVEKDRVAFSIRVRGSMGPRVIHGGLLRLGCFTAAAGCLPDDREAARLAAFCPTVVVGKTSDLLTLAHHLRHYGIDARRLGVRVLLAVGEPGGSVHELRRGLSNLWGAEVHDRYGLTEAGPVAAECPAHPGGLHLPEDGFIAESIDPATGTAVPNGDEGELVLTTLGRTASPIIRYRTGDLVRLLRFFRCGCGRTGPLLAGGVRRARGIE